MVQVEGLRERKKLQTRERIADAAEALFAERGYDSVSVSDIARAVDLSDQTVYNYFPAKHDLVLDRAAAFVDRYRLAVLERPTGSTPADVLHPLVQADVDYFRADRSRLARGQFPTLTFESAELRRFALQFREAQTVAVHEALSATTLGVHPLVLHVHAAGLVAVAQATTDRIGACVLHAGSVDETADRLETGVRAAFSALRDQYLALAPTSHDPAPAAATATAPIEASFAPRHPSSRSAGHGEEAAISWVHDAF